MIGETVGGGVNEVGGVRNRGNEQCPEGGSNHSSFQDSATKPLSHLECFFCYRFDNGLGVLGRFLGGMGQGLGHVRDLLQCRRRRWG